MSFFMGFYYLVIVYTKRDFFFKKALISYSKFQNSKNVNVEDQLSKFVSYLFSR